VGLETVGGSTAMAGVLGTAATWVASARNRAAGREAQTPRLAVACERQARGFLARALRCLAVNLLPKTWDQQIFGQLLIDHGN
jgi:hypothetical protein